MAIKRSNQITFTEQKKIIELKEWYLATSLEDGITRETDGWTTTAQSVNSEKQYLWNYEEVIYSIGPSDVSEPIIIGMYGTGADGRGITDILNYYGVTQTPDLPEEIPDDFWKNHLEAIKELSSENKYLWNYEKILYTDGSSMVGDPVIIGVYGDSGEDAITFQIYSQNGYEFIDDVDEEKQLKEIELKIAAFKGGNYLTDATFTWSYWDVELNEYADIEGYVNTTEKSFVVYDTDEYALSSLKCTMSYNDNIYEDYIVLTTKVDIYNASVSFFNNSNILTQTENYIVGYVELYKNTQLVESVKTTTCYMKESTIDQDTGIINTDCNADEVDNLSYFVCVADNKYSVVLGRYNGTNWIVEDNEVKYVYQIDTDLSSISNVFLVSKSNVNQRANVNIKVYKDCTFVADENGNESFSISTESLLAITNTVISDLNDVIIDTIAPTDAYEGQMWLDPTSGILSIRADGKWISTAKQGKGQNTYTYKPTVYEKGDLWIVSKADEILNVKTADGKILNFTEGSIWIAQEDSDETGFNVEDWSDAVPEITALQNNINYYFDFNEETGLKIGQNNQRFYVNIDATRMSFCENTDIEVSGEEIQKELDPHEVVHIGNKSATIRNLVVNESAKIECSASIYNKVDIVNTYETKKDHPGFTWQMEPDGGFSLVKMEVN